MQHYLISEKISTHKYQQIKSLTGFLYFMTIVLKLYLLFIYKSNHILVCTWFGRSRMVQWKLNTQSLCRLYFRVTISILSIFYDSSTLNISFKFNLLIKVIILYYYHRLEGQTCYSTHFPGYSGELTFAEIRILKRDDNQ